MNEKSRTDNSIRNIMIGIGSEVFILVITFLSRTLFIKILGAEYLGINGLYSNIVLSFTSDDIKKDGLEYDEYINKHLGRRRVEYLSSFVINGNNYNWVSTEVK